DDEESKRPDAMLTANVDRVDEIRSQDGFAVDALLYLRIRTLHSKVDARTAGLRHDGDCRLLKAVDAGFARPLHAEPAPQDLLAACDDPFLVEREHRITKQNVLHVEVAHEVLELVYDVAGRAIPPFEPLARGIWAIATTVRAAARG